MTNDDKIKLKPKQLYTYLSCELYRRRCDFSPLMLDLVIGGMQDDETPFLGHISKLGRAYEDDFIATGLGAYMAIPLLRKYENSVKNLNDVQAKELVHKCMEVLYYRDTRATADYSAAISTIRDNAFVVDLEEKSNTQNWNVSKYIMGYN